MTTLAPSPPCPAFGELVRADGGGAEVLAYGPGATTRHRTSASATETARSRAGSLLRSGYRVEVHRLLPDAFVLYAIPVPLTSSPR